MEKGGAIELSIGTIVIIVLAMSMLILGLVLVKNIFSGATESVNILNDKTKAKIVGLLGDESRDVVVNLGPDKMAKIKPGSENFGVAIGARTKDGSASDRQRLQYKLSLSETDRESCAQIFGKPLAEDLLLSKLNTWINFDEYEGASSFSIILISIPKGTASCSQKINVDVQDTKTNQPVGGAYFIIDIQKGGFGLF